MVFANPGDVNCRLRRRHAEFNDLIVDFMPDDAAILGFTNRWYTEALATAEDVTLTAGAVIRVVSPPYFVGTKLEAYNGRGNNDPIASRDIEDILNVVDGRETLLAEIQAAPAELYGYIAQQFAQLLKHPDFAYCVQSTASQAGICLLKLKTPEQSPRICASTDRGRVGGECKRRGLIVNSI